jgi:hypothetical protein
MKNLTVKKLIRIRVYIIVAIGCLFYLASNAQVIPKKIEGKPDYKETVEFIKATLPKELFKDGLSGTRKKIGYVTDTYKITQLEFDECEITVSYEKRTNEILTNGFKLDPTYVRQSAIIELDKVEDINIVSLSGQKGESCVFGLFFKIKGKNEESRIQIPIVRLDCDLGSFDALKEMQIYKAFNHLRKLCGAPEPIKF